jgi:hypothetical protein
MFGIGIVHNLQNRGILGGTGQAAVCGQWRNPLSQSRVLQVQGVLPAPYSKHACLTALASGCGEDELWHPSSSGPWRGYDHCLPVPEP